MIPIHIIYKLFVSDKRKQHNCPFCDRAFTRPYRLNDHISFSHTDEVNRLSIDLDLSYFEIIYFYFKIEEIYVLAVLQKLLL